MDVLYIFVPCCVFISQPSNIIYLHVFAMLCLRDLKKKKKKEQICPCCLHSQRNRKWWWRLSCSITPMNPLQPVLTSHCCILIQRHKSALSSWLKHYTPIFFCKPVRTVQTTNVKATRATTCETMHECCSICVFLINCFLCPQSRP